MIEPAQPLVAWATFYTMTGSSAAALTGLMFVVITLVTRSERNAKRSDGISTFSTPTVVHFGSALLLSAMLCAPWHTLAGPAIVAGIVGICGIVYVSRVMLATRRLTEYSADLEDWVWYSVAPLLSYAAIVVGAIMLLRSPATALFVTAAGVLLLIFIGIRNAWDIVTYIITGGPVS